MDEATRLWRLGMFANLYGASCWCYGGIMTGLALWGAISMKHPYFEFSIFYLGLIVLNTMIKVPTLDYIVMLMTHGIHYWPGSQTFGVEKIGHSKSLLAWHPHGILCGGFSWHGAWNPELRKEKQPVFLISWALRNAPLFKYFCDCNGWIRAASKENVVEWMSKSKNIALLPGGFEEATLYRRGKHRVYIKKRTGFVKYALQYGYTIHPVYSFGEETTYSSFPYFVEARLWLNKMKIPAVLFWGRTFIPILPKPGKFLTVFGDGIRLPQIEKPSREDVSKWHGVYISKLKDLFEEYRVKFPDYNNAVLEVY